VVELDEVVGFRRGCRVGHEAAGHGQSKDEVGGLELHVGGLIV